MRPFDLKEAQSGAEIITRNESKAEFMLLESEKEYTLPVKVRVEGGEPEYFTIEGKYIVGNNSHLDLFMK